MIQSFWKLVWKFLQKLNMQLPYKPTTIPVGIDLRGMKMYVHTKTSPQIFILILFVIVKKENPDILNGRIVKQTLTHPYHDSYSAITRNELVKQQSAWVSGESR